MKIFLAFIFAVLNFSAFAQSSIPSYQNNTALQSAASTSSPIVIRDSYATIGDSTPLAYASSSAACSLNGGYGDGGSQVPSSDGKCWIAIFPGYIDPTWFGASPSAADNKVALQNALNAAQATGVTKVKIPPGKYTLLSDLSYSLPSSGISSIDFGGAGLDGTILYFANGCNGLTITFPSGRVSAHVHDLSITTGQANSGTALSFVASAPVVDPASTPGSTISNVAIRGDDGYSGGAYSLYFSTGALIRGVTYVQIYNLNVFGPSTHGGDGLVIEGYGTSYAAGVAVTSSNFVALEHGIVYGSYVQGVTVFQSSFPGDTVGIISKPNESGILDGLLVTGSEFATTLYGIITQTAIGNTQIYGNAFQNLNPGGSDVALSLNNVFNVTGNIFETSTRTGTYGLIVGPSSAGGLITGNQFAGLNVGVLLQSGTSGVNVQSNVYIGNSLNVSNGGTSNTVGGGSP